MKYTVMTDDYRLRVISSMCTNLPEAERYIMVVPRSRREMEQGCSVLLRHLRGVLEKRELAFSIIDKEKDKKVCAAVVCVDENSGYTYELKTSSDDSEELRSYEKACVEYAVRTILFQKRMAQTTYNEAHKAFNSLGCAAIQRT